jgi:hypothetical protein
MNHVILLLFILSFSIFSDEKLKGQEIIETLDRTLMINEGLTSATLSIWKGNHETHFWKVNIFKHQDDMLYTFEVTQGRPVAKYISVKRGNGIIYYNVLSGKIFHIEQLEKMESLLHTSFTYLDFSNYLYEANYKVIDVSRTKSKTSESSIITMIPNFFPSYKHLKLYVDNVNYTPQKIDFTSPNGLLIKTLKFKYGKIKIRDGNSISELPTLTRLEMNDNSTNYTSILEFKEWNKNVKPDKTFYEIKTMYEK